MSDILCKWLNQELRLSKAVEPKTFAKDFSTGYLIGEVLHKYQLQNDFSMFMRKETSTSRLNNYTRLEPTLQLLGISFNKNTVQELTQEKPGVATRLLYQLYVSLEKKNRAEITGTVMEIMQPSTNAGLHKNEHDIYSDRLHQLVKRDPELKLPKISQHFEEKCEQLNNRSVMTHPVQQKRPLKGQDERRTENNEKVPKPPPYALQLNLKRRRQQQQQQQRREQQGQMVQAEIAQFETNRKKMVSSGFASFSSGQPMPGDFPISGSGGTKLILQSNSKYIQEIRQRLEENAVAREQKEQRLDRFLVEQLKAHEAQEEARREEQLVKRLTRQTKQEQRLASQLLQIRLQKDVIQQNRLFREQQYQQRRERDFHEALEREAALAQQAKLDRAEEIRKELEFLKSIAAERAQGRYDKHFKSCRDILEQIVDLATKVGEYRLITANLIPEKQMREWKELLISGLPLYEPIKGQQPGFELSAPVDPVELKKQEKLNNQDYGEYTNMVGEWTWPEEAGETKSPPTNNSLLGHVVLRLRNIVHPPPVELVSTSLPHFYLKACVLGKFCSGKTTFLAKIAKAHGICVLSADTLVEEALKAHHNGEVTEQPKAKDSEQQLTSSMSCTSLVSDLDTQEESKETHVTLSTRAVQGAAAEKELQKGNAVPNELLVDIIVNAIRQVPARSGWILDGFPVDITQAHLLEKALGGAVDAVGGVESSRVNLAVDPDPPKPLPPARPVLDLALLLDLPDEAVVTRTFSHTDVDAAADTTSHPTDNNMYVAQIPHRITAFQDTWPKLEEWFGEKQNILVRVNANVVKDELYRKLESLLQQILMQNQDHATPVEHVLDSGKVPDSTDETSRARESKSSFHKGKAHRGNPHKKSCTLSAKGNPKMSSASVTSEHKNPLESVYVDDPLPQGIAEYLYTYWETVCDSYVNNTKTVMQQLRSQSVVISHHLFNIREEFKHYLGRPDMRQVLVTQWQKDFNSVSDDMRDDEDTKAELHLRLDELREHLWDVSDKRKEQDEEERTSIMTNGWLEEHSVVLANHHSILTQVELDRFQGTLYILRVYYFSMEKHALPEPPSELVCIRLLCIPEKKDKDKSTEPSQLDDGEESKIIKFVPLLPKSPVSPNGVSKTPRKEEVQAQTEHVKTPQEKLLSDYEEALGALSRLGTGQDHQGETKEQESVQEKEEKEKASASANKKGKGKAKPPAKKKQGPPSTPAPSPAPVDEKKPEETPHEVRSEVQIEHAAALEHEENATKVRIALVKGHGLVMVQRLQSKAEQAFSDMEKWLKAHYLLEMKSIDQLSEVVRHHIEAGAKLQKELRLECTDFYLNGDCHMVASKVPPLRPPPLEKSTLCTPTITQLESLHKQLRIIAPSGLMSSFEFSNMLRDVTSVNMGRNILPESWINMNEKQLMEIVSMLMDDCELVDWRRFLLSAALPWPFPSLTQLLAVLQRFKAADTGNRGFLNREQYLKTELWFSSESVQPVPEDPTDPLPYDRLANLRKYFFRLFADHSFSPPRLDYVSMLQYFAAAPNPRRGFIRALSVVLGKHLKHSSPGHLVKSMPSMEEDSELSLSELDGEREETPCASSSSLVEQDVSIPALLAVIRHKVPRMKDGQPLPPGCPTKKEHTQDLVHIFRELGCKPESRVPFSTLCRHPIIQGLMETSTHHQLVNIHEVLLARQGEGESNSLTPS